MSVVKEFTQDLETGISPWPLAEVLGLRAQVRYRIECARQKKRTYHVSTTTLADIARIYGRHFDSYDEAAPFIEEVAARALEEAHARAEKLAVTDRIRRAQ